MGRLYISMLVGILFIFRFRNNFPLHFPWTDVYLIYVYLLVSVPIHEGLQGYGFTTLIDTYTIFDNLKHTWRLWTHGIFTFGHHIKLKKYNCASMHAVLSP